jgi:hypothetical protein
VLVQIWRGWGTTVGGNIPSYGKAMYQNIAQGRFGVVIRAPKSVGRGIDGLVGFEMVSAVGRLVTLDLFCRW